MNDLCDDYIENLINKYIKFGWNKLTVIFRTNKIAKEKELNLDKSIKLLKMLSSIRKYYVDYLFNCNNSDKNTIYKSFGTKNITSDYDISILGTNAPEIMIKMFNSFLNKYKNSLATSFDTNIYCVGYFSSIDINTKLTKQIADNISILQLKTKEDIKIGLIFSFMKLIDIDFSNYKITRNIKNIINDTKKYLCKLNNIYNNVHQNTKKNIKILNV